MDFGCLLGDPIMQDTVVKQLFFSSRRYGRFSLHSVRCDACAIRLNIAFFHVFFGSRPTVFRFGSGHFLDGKSVHQNANIPKLFKTCNVKNARQISAYR